MSPCLSAATLPLAHRRARAGGRAAFTLVELLVVIGIIAVLIGILLPALNQARKQANTVQCSSNMRQIAMAVLTYANANKGILMPGEVESYAGPSTANTTNLYPDGWFWAAELVNQKYINAPTLRADPSNTTRWQAPPNMGVFQCPEGLTPDAWDPAGSNGRIYGDCPRSANNSGWTYIHPLVPRRDGLQPYNTGTYYQLNMRQTRTSSGYADPLPFWPGGTWASPFVQFRFFPGDVTDPRFTRKLSQIRHSSMFVMMGESSTIDWIIANPNNVPNSAPSKNGYRHYASRISGRHGRPTHNNTNGMTNFAFMDGHVETRSTDQIDFKDDKSFKDLTGKEGVAGAASMRISDGIVFNLYLDHQ